MEADAFDTPSLACVILIRGIGGNVLGSAENVGYEMLQHYRLELDHGEH